MTVERPATPHGLAPEDRAFVAAFEAGAVPPGEFGHRAHVRLAYAYLVDHDIDGATSRMREALLSFLRRHDLDVSKYHETLTRAWVMAVRHFMTKPGAAESADGFIDAHPELLDPNIMLTHYSAEVLFSDEARARFVEPDRDGIPAPPGATIPPLSERR